MRTRTLGPSLARAVSLALALGAAIAPRAGAATLPVAAGGDLQAALASARPGDVVMLEAGATFTGNFVLPVTTGDGMITVRTALPPALEPAAGVRVTPDSGLPLARIVSPNTSPAIATAARAHHWRLQWLEVTSTKDGAGDLIALGTGAKSQNSLDLVPHHLVVEQCYVHGAPGGQKRGIALNSASTTIRDSSIVDIKKTGQDSQGIAGWNGPGPYTIENNLIEAAGENILFGGADPPIWNLVTADITVRRNVLRKPIEWRDANWSVKNLFELKNARRVLVEGNLLENVWKAGQSGYAVVLTPRNQDGRAPWATVEDVTFRNNVIRHAGGGFNLTGTDDVNPSGEGRRIRIANNLMYDVSGSHWGGSGHFMQIGNGASDIILEHNTVQHTGNLVMAYGRRAGQPKPMSGFVFRDNVARHNNYGVMGDSGSPGQVTLSMYFPGATFARNVVAGGNSGKYPADNLFPTVAEFQAQFVDMDAGDFRLVGGSAWSLAASDGSDLGVNFNALDEAMRGGMDAGPSPSPAPRPAPLPSRGDDPSLNDPMVARRPVARPGIL